MCFDGEESKWICLGEILDAMNVVSNGDRCIKCIKLQTSDPRSCQNYIFFFIETFHFSFGYTPEN